MSDKVEIVKKRVRKGKTEGKFHKTYSYELRLKAVKLHVEDGIDEQVVARELGVSKASLGNWVRGYRTLGEEALRNKNCGRGKGKKNLPEPVTEKILELKQQEPSWGVKRIAQVLKRVFWLPGSAETVRQRLTEAGMMNNERAKGRRNLTRPRFFERATPNQLWQTDIFTFRLGGKYAYLIAFLDDYSRYVVGADLFRSPTGAAVIEVYRVAMGEYQPPKEMLTDNGRQYTAWRGKSPLNSPTYYPSYNGGIEKGIRELKERLERELPVPESWNLTQVGAFVAVAAAEENYKPRRCLGGATAKEVYSQKQSRGHWSQRQRHEAFAWTSARAKVILQQNMKTDQRSVDAAWRHAVEAWLCDQALIEVHINP